MLDALLDFLLGLGAFALEAALRYAKKHPIAVVVVVLAVLRALGTTVHTGQAGVLFFCGRARKVLEPGFHPLIPFLHRVRQTPIRSVTLDLPRQRVTTADGLVYVVDTTLVYRVEDPIRALTAIDDLKKGCLTLMPLLVHALLREQTGATLASRQALDADLAKRAADALARWGVAVEQAGLSTLSPTRHTARLTQLAGRVRERARLLRELLDRGTAPAAAVALVAPARLPVGRAHARYRARRLARRRRRAAGPHHPAPALGAAHPPTTPDPGGPQPTQGPSQPGTQRT
jgi:regulator of protease activity HflC (stomatin/prohibitin superfamily)